MSNFRQDLNKEELLSLHLDKVYDELDLNFTRVKDINEQHRGIDLKYNHRGRDYLIDEKAQLDYINSDLPTFTFELSYIKDGSLKKGWFYDRSKDTDHYFLVTGIKAVDKTDLTKGFTACKITSVNRGKLIQHLTSIGLTAKKLFEYASEIRNARKEGKTIISELKWSEGAMYFSPQKSEEPINLQLRLHYLISNGLAKRIYPPS